MKQRPAGVTVLAILNFIGTGILFLLGILMLLGFGIFATVILRHVANASQGAISAAALGTAGIVIAMVLFFFGCLAGLIGYGLWTLREWARITSIVLAALGLVGGIMGTVFVIFHFQLFSVILIGLRLAINVVIIWYLVQPHVKQAFALQPAIIVS